MSGAWLAATLAVALAMPFDASAGSGEADVALVLAIDVSGSVDNNRFALQREGIAAALESEEVAAAVVLHQHGGTTASALIKHCRERLAEYKAPKKIYIVPNIPLTATGKVRRKQVAAALLDGQLS